MIPAGPVIPLSAPQLEFLNTDRPFTAFVGGIGSGKSFVLCYDLLRRARRGNLYMMVAPSYPSLRDSTLRSFFDVTERLGVPVEFHRGEHRAYLPRTDIEILFRSGDNPESLRGPNLAGAGMDEASLMTRDVYDVLIGRLRQNGGAGFLRAAFTPKGPTHWTYDVFARGKPDTALVRAATAENPFLDPVFHERLTRQYDSQFARQELGGEFVSLAGAAFPPSYFEGEDLYFDRWPSNLAWRVIGCDPSACTTKGGDYWAYAVVGMTTPDNTFWVDAHLERESGAVKMVGRGLDLVKSFAPLDSFAFEDNQSLGLLWHEYIRQANERGLLVPLKAVVNTNTKAERIRSRLGAYLDQRRFRFRRTPGCELLVNQLRDFPFAQDGHDDGPDALELAVRELERLVLGLD